MAALTVSAWVASPLIKTLVDKVRSYIEGQFNWQKDIKRKLQELEIGLKEIQTVVEKAEQLQSLDASQKELLCSIKNVIYEADDVLDEFEYQILEVQAMKATGSVSHTAFSSHKFAKRLIGQDKLPKKLKNILDKMDSIRKSANTFNVQVAASTMISANEPGQNTHDYDTSSDSTSEPSGRDMVKNMLIDLLLQKVDEPESHHMNIPIITIIGVGGIGKTTLVQYVYNDQRVNEQFDLMMWVCVSNNFDETRLTKKILESASRTSEKHKDVLNLDTLKRALQIELRSKRFLLVLDDVWIDEKRTEFVNQKMWEKILVSLKAGKKGSKILATTRTDIVARMIGTTNSISLTGLSNDENWSILKMYAFGNEVPDNYQELEEIGKEIVKKLKGSPLAASVVGAMLKDSLDPNEWSQILQIEVFNDVMSVLGLSYQRLPDHLKPCFSYCSIFPKDRPFTCLELVPLWIAEGYVHRIREDRRTLMCIGMDYFKQLSSRSFFQKDPNIDTYYIMHDLIHDLAEFVSADECFRIDDANQKEISKTIRHLGVHTYDEDKIKNFVAEKMNNLKDLRTLKFFGDTLLYSRNFLDGFSMLEKFMKLRVLDLRVLHFSKFPQGVSHLRHLRYLHLGYNDFEILPESVCGLYQLEVLVAVNLLQLSKSLYRLLKFGRLTHLDVLELVFEVGKNGLGIGVLKCMGMQVVFRGRLCIMNLKNVGCKEEAVEADLDSKQYLTDLELDWQRSIYGDDVDDDDDDDIADDLRPHKNLELLTIKGFGGIRPPSWLQTKWLVKLQSLALIECFHLQVLPSLEHLPSLRSLSVSKCPSLTEFLIFHRTIADIFVGAPGLISVKYLYEADFQLRISVIPETLRALEHDHQLRAIKKLQISRDHYNVAERILKCADLKEVTIWCCPELTSEEVVVRSLIINDCPGTGSWLSRCLQGLAFLSDLTVDFWPHLTSLPSLRRLTVKYCSSEGISEVVLPQCLESLEIYNCRVSDTLLSACLQGLTSLSQLKIHSCTGLTSLPSAQVLQCLTALQELTINDTEELMSLGGLHAHASLKHLEVSSCPELKESVDGCLQGLASLSDLTVDFWPHVTSLPSLRRLTVEHCEFEGTSEVGLPQCLESLEINYCDVSDTLLSTCLQGLTFLSQLKIHSCTGLTSLPSAQVLQCLTALQELTINDSGELMSLGGLQAHASLKRLEVSSCPKLMSLPEEGLPCSIEYLNLRGCHPALKQQIHEKKGPQWNKVAHISDIDIN